MKMKTGIAALSIVSALIVFPVWGNPAPMENNPAAQTVNAENAQTSSLFSLSVLPTFSTGFGHYRDYRKTGTGADIALVTQLGPVAVKPLAGLSYNFPENSAVDKSIAVNLSVLGGFAFPLGASFTITPCAGGGMIFHRISGKKDGKNETKNYFNSTAQVSVDMEYLLSSRFSLVFSPSYNLVFEQGRTDQFMCAGFGVKIGL